MPTEGIFGTPSQRILLPMAGVGDKVFGGKLLSKSSMNFLPDGPANCSAGKAWLKRFLGQGAHCQERWRGQVTSCISRHPALAPALAVKIDAAPFQKFDPLSQTSYLLELGAARTTPPPRRLLTLSLGASAGTK